MCSKYETVAVLKGERKLSTLSELSSSVGSVNILSGQLLVTFEGPLRIVEHHLLHRVPRGGSIVSNNYTTCIITFVGSREKMEDLVEIVSN